MLNCEHIKCKNKPTVKDTNKNTTGDSIPVYYSLILVYWVVVKTISHKLVIIFGWSVLFFCDFPRFSKNGSDFCGNSFSRSDLERIISLENGLSKDKLILSSSSIFRKRQAIWCHGWNDINVEIQKMRSWNLAQMGQSQPHTVLYLEIIRKLTRFLHCIWYFKKE